MGRVLTKLLKMGASSSQVAGLEDQFTAEEISRLSKIFKKLDTDKSGTLSFQEILDLPAVKKNPLARRIIAVLDHDMSGEIDFKEFVHGMCQFSSHGDRETKLKFAFKIYDMDNDGYITTEDLYQVLKLMVGSNHLHKFCRCNLKDDQLQQLVNRTIRSADVNQDGKISFEEFCKIVGKNDFDKKMNFDDAII